MNSSLRRMLELELCNSLSYLILRSACNAALLLVNH